MPRLAIPLHDNKTARRDRRAVWKLILILVALGLVWFVSQTVFTRNIFAKHTPQGTTHTILIELTQNNRTLINDLVGEIQPLQDRGLTVSEILPYSKGYLALFVSPSQNTLGLDVSLPEEFKQRCYAQDITITEPVKGISLLSTEPVVLEVLEYRLGLLDRLDPRGVGFVIAHNLSKHNVMSIKTRPYGYSLQTNQATSETTLDVLPDNTGLALAVSPHEETINKTEGLFGGLETDFVKSMLHELKNHGGTVFATNLGLKQVGFIINRVIPEEILVNIHNYYETGLTADTSGYVLPDQTLVYEIVRTEPTITATWNQEGDINSYETENLISIVDSKQTLISNYQVDLNEHNETCSKKPSVIFFPQKSNKTERLVNISDNLDIFLDFINNFVEVSLDNHSKKQVIKLCF